MAGLQSTQTSGLFSCQLPTQGGICGPFFVHSRFLCAACTNVFSTTILVGPNRETRLQALMRVDVAHPARVAIGEPAPWHQVEVNGIGVGLQLNRTAEIHHWSYGRQREGSARLQLRARRAVSTIRLLLQHVITERCLGSGWSDVSPSLPTGSPLGVHVVGRPGVRYQHHCLADRMKISQTRLRLMPV